MIDDTLREYKGRGLYPYENWATDSESFFLLQRMWLDIIEHHAGLSGYVADQEVIQRENSYIVSVRKKNRRLLIYPLPNNAECGLDFYLKHPLDANGNQDIISSLLVLDSKLVAPYLQASVDILKEFDAATIGNTSYQDQLYRDLLSSYGYLLAYPVDGL